MNRRDAIKQTALIMGYAVSASAVSAVVAGCEVNQEPSWTPAVLSQEQSDMLAEITERILPRTTTPGAKDVYVHRFIDVLLDKYMPKDEVDQFIKGLDSVNTKSQAAYQKPFIDLSDENKDAILTDLHAEAEKMGRTPTPFFNAVKELTLVGYFTSEKVGKEVLNWDPVPGKYDNCIPLEQNGGVNWAI